MAAEPDDVRDALCPERSAALQHQPRGRTQRDGRRARVAGRVRGDAAGLPIRPHRPQGAHLPRADAQRDRSVTGARGPAHVQGRQLSPVRAGRRARALGRGQERCFASAVRAARAPVSEPFAANRAGRARRQPARPRAPEPGQLAGLVPWRRQLSRAERVVPAGRRVVHVPLARRRPVPERRVHASRRLGLPPSGSQLRRGPAERPGLEPARGYCAQGRCQAVSAPETTNRVQVAAHHWRPRFVANGIDVNDFDDTVAKTTEWKDWGPNWRAVGRTHEALGREALKRGRDLSAAQAFQRAAWCYHLGKFLWFEDLLLHAELRDRAVSLYRKAAPHLDPPAQRLEIPFEGHTIPGNFRRPRDSWQPPLVLLVPGLDSSKEELFAIEEEFLHRGMATLAVDGPGQSENSVRSEE